MESIRPSADLRNHYSEISRLCRENRQPVYILSLIHIYRHGRVRSGAGRGQRGGGCDLVGHVAGAGRSCCKSGGAADGDGDRLSLIHI